MCEVQQRRGSDKDGYDRDMRSHKVVTAFHYFGGMPLFQIFIALGDVPDSVVELVNAELEARARTAGEDPQTLSSQASRG